MNATGQKRWLRRGAAAAVALCGLLWWAQEPAPTLVTAPQGVAKKAHPPTKTKPKAAKKATHTDVPRQVVAAAPARDERSAGDETPTEDLSTSLIVHVIETDGTSVRGAQVLSSDCDLWRVARGGTVRLQLKPDQVCTIRGGRRDGMLMAWSEPETVEGGYADDEIYLEVPVGKTAGLGISVAEHEYGVLVRHVFPGSPAAEAGLIDGDIIVELNRQDTAQLPIDSFIQQATGPEGTDVELVVARTASEDDWHEFTVTVTRKAITRQQG